eukprot:TRINITY_DN14157_c0_g1_i2.p1 TRINITY_DN14157_c0_g1~~TRINITY_DN14157_c0_g1_i2.p1  ORF type:complete len:117 (-),score=3.09 TRINITY_DN14157_c0_g1_i2:104-454(-)
MCIRDSLERGKGHKNPWKSMDLCASWGGPLSQTLLAGSVREHICRLLNQPLRPNKGNRTCPMKGCRHILNIADVPGNILLRSPCGHWGMTKTEGQISYRAVCCISDCTGTLLVRTT